MTSTIEFRGSDDFSCLYTQVKSNNLLGLKQGLANYKDINHKNSDGETLLSYAVDLGHYEIVEFLLDAGANPELGGWTSPLNLSCINGMKEIVELLIVAGSDVNQKLDKDTTALMSASRKGHIDIVKMLINVGANVNIVSRKASTALLLAALNAHSDVFEYLLPKCSDDIRSFSITRAIQTASVSGDISVISLLKQFNIDLNMKLYGGKTALILARDYDAGEQLMIGQYLEKRM